MRERPILFSALMVRAILAGQKTQTRRAVKPQPANDPALHHPIEPYTNGRGNWNWVLSATGHGTGDPFPCPYGTPGDRLWVREAWNKFDGWAMYSYRADDNSFGVGDSDDPDHVPEHALKWKPSIHMPRAASRITLEITDVRVERLEAISRGDAMAEGCPFPNMAAGDDPRQWFSGLWKEINGAESWDANPWVWVVEFEHASGTREKS